MAGPPGTGKTLTARVLARKLNLTLVTVLMDKLVTKFMGEKDIELNADELIQALTDVRDHVAKRRKITMRTTTVAIPARVEKMKPEEVRAIRSRLNVSQEVFARLLNVPVVTEASWEVGRRNPSGAALRLLQIAKRGRSGTGS